MAIALRRTWNEDIALVKEQFNQISPENDLKWESIHPREGADGYNFGPPTPTWNFGLKNHMLIVDTRLSGSADPAWVFAGLAPPFAADAPPPTLPPGDWRTARHSRGAAPANARPY